MKGVKYILQEPEIEGLQEERVRNSDHKYDIKYQVNVCNCGEDHWPKTSEQLQQATMIIQLINVQNGSKFTRFRSELNENDMHTIMMAKELQ